MKPIYLSVKENKVTDITFEKTEIIYGETVDETTIEEVKDFIGFNTYNLKWFNNCLIVDSPKKLSEMDILKAKLEASLEQNKFLEDCVVEMAGVVYG